MTEFRSTIPTGERPLPDPGEARGAFLEAEATALSVRRLLDASRCLFTGNLAMMCCLPITVMTWWTISQSEASRIVGVLALVGVEIGMVVSLVSLGRLRTSAGVPGKGLQRLSAQLCAGAD